MISFFKRLSNIFPFFCILLGLLACDDEPDLEEAPDDAKLEMMAKKVLLDVQREDAYISQVRREAGRTTYYFNNEKSVTIPHARTPFLAIDSMGCWTLNGKATTLKGVRHDRSVPRVEVGENGNWWLDGQDTQLPSLMETTPLLPSLMETEGHVVFDISEDSCLWVIKQLKPAFLENQPLPVGCDTLRVLALGNSYTLDAIAYLHEMVRASGIDLNRLSVYVCTYGGASLEYWQNKIESDDTVLIKKAAGYLMMKKRGPLKELLQQNWDVVCVQQNSSRAVDYLTFNPYLHAIIDDVKQYCPNPNVAFAWQMAWSYWKGYRKVPFLWNRYERICEAVKEMQIRDGIDILIPIGTTIENARQTSLQTPHDLTRDGTHIALGVGRYLAAATWFQSILAKVFGRDIVDNPFLYEKIKEGEQTSNFETEKVTLDNVGLCKECVVAACQHPFKVSFTDKTDKTDESMPKMD